MRRRVRVVAAALALVVVAIDLPAVAAAEPPQPDAAAQAADAGPAPESEPRDLQKELSGGTARVEVEANLPNKEKSEEPEKVDELVQYRSEGSETWTTTDGANVTEFFGEQKWYRDSKGEWAEVDPKLVEMARVYGARRLTVFRRVVLPAALPQIFVGLRLSATTSLLLLIAAEMIGANSGVGFQVMNAQYNFQIPLMFAAILLLALLGLTANLALETLQARLCRWSKVKD